MWISEDGELMHRDDYLNPVKHIESWTIFNIYDLIRYKTRVCKIDEYELEGIYFSTELPF